MMFVEPLVQRLCAACVHRNLLSARQTGLHRLLSTNSLQTGFHRLLSTNSLHQRKNTREPDNVRLHHRSFMASCGWQNKPKDEFDIAKNPFFDKYQEKLKHLREYDIPFPFKNSNTDPEEFSNRIANMEDKKTGRMKPPVEPAQDPIQKPSVPGHTGPRSWPPKSLDEVMKVELLKDLDAKAIDQIWKEHYLSKDCVFSVIPGAEYDELYAKSKLSPNFIFTLPKGDGFEFYLCQFSGKDVYFTPLGMYQLVKENAPPCLTVCHFPDLKEEKGIVLMAGEYDRKVISKSEALILVKQMALFYGRDASHRHTLVRMFNKTPEKFAYMDVIEEYKRNRTYLEDNPY